MKNLNRVALATLAATALALTAGCGNSGSGTGSGNTGSDKLTIGLSLSTLNNPFFKDLEAGAKEAAAKLGVNLVVNDAQDDATTQINHIQTFSTQGVKAIIINPVDSKQAAPAAKAAENAKIPLVAVDRAVEGGKVASFIASDNVQGGQLAAEALVKAVGSGDILHLQGVVGASASRDRGKGFLDGLKSASGIKVAGTQTAEFNRAKGLSVTTDLLQAKPGVKGLFAENDEMALGAIQALGDKAGKDVKVVGFDGTADGLAAIASGKLVASIAQQPKELGKQAVEQAVKAAKGEAPKDKIDVPVKVVTKDNLAEFKK